MVAISLYRGNLHRAPDVPRRWLMPNPKISLKDFRTLLARRSKALSRLQSTAIAATATAIATSSNPNPLSITRNGSLVVQLEVAKSTDVGEGSSGKGEGGEEGGGDRREADSKKPILLESDLVVDCKNEDLVKADEQVDAGPGSIEKQSEPITDNLDVLNEKEKRKKEVEDKLQVLNAKKHNLVLVLKQILNAEEELKRRNSMQAVAMRGGPSVPLQPDGTNDTGSVIRNMAPRLGSEGNLIGDVADGGEADDLANHNMHSRHMLRTSSMSPSSESPLRRTPNIQQNVVSHPSRAASLGATVSPSRFALSGHQGNPMNLPSMSVSGASYIASSPSPAASGGTSVFRDARQPSPWK